MCSGVEGLGKLGCPLLPPYALGRAVDTRSVSPYRLLGPTHHQSSVWPAAPEGSESQPQYLALTVQATSRVLPWAGWELWSLWAQPGPLRAKGSSPQALPEVGHRMSPCGPNLAGPLFWKSPALRKENG